MTSFFEILREAIRLLTFQSPSPDALRRKRRTE